MTPVEYVWAVDVAVARLAFAFAPLTDGGEIEVETLHTDSDARDGKRLGWLDRQVRIYAGQHSRRHLAACVWVEQPGGRFVHPQLWYAAGVVQAALFETLACPVWTLPPSAWKKRTVGKGNASKEQVAAWVTAQGAGFNGQDEADAYAIAAAGRAMVQTGSWDATVPPISKEAA